MTINPTNGRERMDTKDGRVPTEPGSHPSGHAADGVDGAPRFDPSRDDDYGPRPFEDDIDGCWNCGGEGYIYGCSWDWQCDTYDPGEGTCLCARPCDVCRPRDSEGESAGLKCIAQ